MIPGLPTFQTGQLAARALARLARDPRPIRNAAVGRDPRGEVEIVPHDDLQAAADDCAARGYEAGLAIFWSAPDRDDVRTCLMHVLEQRAGALRPSMCVECLARGTSPLVVKVSAIDVREAYYRTFLDGFARGCLDEAVELADAPAAYVPRQDAHRLGLAVGGALVTELLRPGGTAEAEVGIRLLPGVAAAQVARSAERLDRDDAFWQRPRQAATLREQVPGVLVIRARPRAPDDLIWLAVEVARGRGGPRTSTIDPVLPQHSSSDDDRAFTAALLEGVALDPRAGEVLAGLGALGAFRRSHAIMSFPERGVVHQLRRLWRGTKGLFARDSAARPEKVQVLGIERDPTRLYRIFGGDVCAMPRAVSGTTLVVSEARADYQLVRATDLAPEPGYVYFLDADGDVSRLRVG